MRTRIPLVGVLAVAGCSAVSPTQVGQTAGTIAGSVIAPGIGAPLGTLVGTLAGLVVEHQVDKVREKKERVELTKQLQNPATSQAVTEGPPPQGQPTRMWVDEHLEQGRLIVGHFELRAIP